MNEFGQRRPIFAGPPPRNGAGTRNPLLQSSEAFNELKFRLHSRLIEELDPSKLESGDQPARPRSGRRGCAHTHRLGDAGRRRLQP